MENRESLQYIDNNNYCVRLNEFLRYYLCTKAKSENTIISYGHNANEFLQFVRTKKKLHGLSDSQLKRIEKDDILDFTTKLLAKNMEKSTINNKRSAIFQLLKYLTRKGVLKENPYKDIDKFVESRGKQEYFTIEEANKIISVAENKRDRLLFIMYANCGFRKSEVLKLTLEDVETDELVFKGKGSKYRELTLNDIVIGAINDWLPERERLLKSLNVETDLLFIDEKGQELKFYKVTYLIKKYGKLAELPEKKCHAHSFRRTYASISIKNGTDMVTLQKSMGHKRSSTTDLYLEVDSEQRRRASNNVRIGG